MKYASAVLLAMFSGLLFAASGLHTEEIDYRANGQVMKGYLAYDERVSGRRPGVLVVHEWWGHNDYARQRARMLAELGFTALAVDMYGDGKQAAHPDEAGKFAGAVRKNLPLARARFDAALQLLRDHATTDPRRVAAIGYCFGGGVVLEMARQGVDLDGVVSFHGSLGTAEPAAPGAVKAHVLVLTGADDPVVPAEQVAKFEEEMKQAGADFRVIVYPGAKHAFTNPGADELGARFGLPQQYNAPADAQSWAAMRAFFDAIFATP